MTLVIALRFVGLFLLISAAAYMLPTLLAVWIRRRRRVPPEFTRGVTVLKPLCGDEPRLYENLRSFCEQDHPEYQILFGVREPHDAALVVAQRLQAEFPQRDIEIVVDSRVHGLNLKVSNLLNLMPKVRHDWLVLADSDIAVRPDYLRRVTAPLATAQVGLVTCLYRGRALGGLWSHLGTQFIDDWFLPSVRLSQLFGATRFGFGATLALRRETLEMIGGFESVSAVVADDFRLAERIAEHGLATLLSDHEVTTDVAEIRLGDLVARELRWFRTIRSVRPGSYLGTGICFTLPVTALGLLLAGLSALSVGLALTAIVARLLLFADAQSHRSAGTRKLGLDLAAFMLRDSLSLLLWAWAFRSARIRWRGQQMSVEGPAEARGT